MTSKASAITVTDLTVRFGGLTALHDVTFAVSPGIILGMIGPNGAGKTTLFDAICGLVSTAAGSVLIGETEVTGLRPFQRSALGLGRSFQDGRLFPSLTVQECISIALTRHVPPPGALSALIGGFTARSSTKKAETRVKEVVGLMGLETYKDMHVRDLSTGTRRLVDLACALAHEPTLLLLDEPSSGIAQREVEALAPMIRRIREETSSTMLLIEHDIPLVMEVSDELLALETGGVIARGIPEEVVEDPEVVRSYLGADKLKAIKDHLLVKER
jgi:ABC-type branched-subunit amino acid transport system ATPase component